jgi:hypothetical protein
MSKKLLMTQLKFIGKISKSGTDRNVVIIPKQFKKETDKIRGKDVLIIIEDEFLK